MSYLHDLNEQQREAVLHTEGPLLIMAGAGSGKTKTITYRIAHLIEKGVSPENILAVTFTNKAANEMRDRVDRLLQTTPALKRPVETLGRPVIKTFHSLGVLILRENVAKLHLPKQFSILDRADSKKIVRDILKADGYDPKQYDPAKILAIISRQKGDMISPEEYADGPHGHTHISSVVENVWHKYEQQLHRAGALDFDDLLVKTVHLLEKDTATLAAYQNRFSYIHVDEYQDTNEVQYQMVKLLAAKHNNICVVGDVDQNIYTWRGATIRNIMSFEQDYPGAREITLEENYRSTKNILRAANEVIQKNTVRRKKNLFTNNHAGEKIHLYRAIDEYDEAEFAVGRAKELIARGVPADEIVFLYRANFQSRVLEEICLKHNLPHQVIGTKFFDRAEVKDVIAYIKVALNERDFSNMQRIVNTPPRGIGKVTALKIELGQEGSLTPAVQEKIKKFRSLLEKIRTEIEQKRPAEIIALILHESGLEKHLRDEGDEGIERIQNIKELASLAKKYEQLPPREGMNAFLDDISLTTDQDDLDRNERGVKLMTVHAAKGLEFDHVFVTGLESGLFPMEREDDVAEDAEEERRLFYVAITRAKKKVYLTWASFRTIFGNKQVSLASEFLDDISEEIIESEDYNGTTSAGKNKKDGGTIEYLIDF